MTAARWWRQPDSPYLLVDTNLRIVASNRAYSAATDHSEDRLMDRCLFEAFPDNPADPEADGVEKLGASLETVFTERRRHWMGVQRYDVPDPGVPGRFSHKIWIPINTPIHDGRRVVGAVHHVDDVTAVLAEAGSADRWKRIQAGARDLGPTFSELVPEAVVGVLTHSYRVAMDELGPDHGGAGGVAAAAERLAVARLEVLAGHPAARPHR